MAPHKVPCSTCHSKSLIQVKDGTSSLTQMSPPRPTSSHDYATAGKSLACDQYERQGLYTLPKEKYMRFIQNASRYGLPVRFLERVACTYTVGPTSLFQPIDSTNTFFRVISFEKETLESVKDMDPSRASEASRGILNIYHESTHAYLNIEAGASIPKSFIAAGEKYYKGALTTKRRVNTNPQRVFQEAAASYVGGRAAAWWMALEHISFLKSRQKTTPEQIEIARKRYNKAMAERGFGYSDEGGFLGIGAQETETTKPISTVLKAFLDHQLLEDQIPDSFDNAKFIQDMILQPIR